MIKHGPVDVIALAAGEPVFNGDVFRILEKHVSEGNYPGVGCNGSDKGC